MFEALHQQKNLFVLDRGIKVRATQPYAISLELSMMVRLASAVPDEVLRVRTADVWIGVVSTRSLNGVKPGASLGLLLARLRYAGYVRV